MSDALSPEVLKALAAPEAYREDASAARGVEWVQTHLSHVFLTGERVYKLRKPVDLDFVCFRTREERNADCLREVALNRRLAPDVYLGLAPIEAGTAEVRVGALGEELACDERGEALEHCVVMRRLPAGRDAQSLLEAGRFGDAQLERLADVVARFHAENGLGAPAPFTREEWRTHCTRPVEDSFSMLEGASAAAPPALLAQARERCRDFASRCADRFERRRVEGRAIDGHGDLHLQHVWYESDEGLPIAIDCLEFAARLRRIDAAAEVAFPAMDLRYRGHPTLAERFLGLYAAARDDYGLYAVVDYFIAYRAAVRAKVASLAARDTEIQPAQRAAAEQSAQRHLGLAAEALEPRGAGPLVLVGGVVGTGKSTAAREISAATGLTVVSTDRVRRHVSGDPEPRAAQAGLDAGRYAAPARARVYGEVLERARQVLASGRGAVLDATWSRRADRDRARDLARSLGSRVVFVEACCAAEVALGRLSRRTARGGDDSEAGPELHATSLERFEAWASDEAGERHVMHTDREGWKGEIAAWARALFG